MYRYGIMYSTTENTALQCESSPAGSSFSVIFFPDYLYLPVELFFYLHQLRRTWYERVLN